MHDILYRYVVGVDTHAATHSYAIVAASGALLDQATFPTTPDGLCRARDWIGRRTEGDLDTVLVAAEGTGCYGATLGDVLEGARLPGRRGTQRALNQEHTSGRPAKPTPTRALRPMRGMVRRRRPARVSDSGRPAP